MRVEATGIDHLTPVRMAVIKKMREKWQGGRLKKRNHSFFLSPSPYFLTVFSWFHYAISSTDTLCFSVVHPQTFSLPLPLHPPKKKTSRGDDIDQSTFYACVEIPQ
jgi:hypothetical protein